MTRAIHVEVDAEGKIHPAPGSALPHGRAILTWQTPANEETLQLSEGSLAEDWLRPEEDAAWAHLQPAK